MQLKINYPNRNANLIIRSSPSFVDLNISKQNPTYPDGVQTPLQEKMQVQVSQ